MTVVLPGLPAAKPRSEVSVKILKGPVHLLKSHRIHFPASLAQAFPTTLSSYHAIRRCNTSSLSEKSGCRGVEGMMGRASNQRSRR